MPDGVGFLSFATERVKTNKNVRSKESALAAATESGQLPSKQRPNLKHWEGFGSQSQHYSNSLIILYALNPVSSSNYLQKHHKIINDDFKTKSFLFHYLGLQKI